MNTKVKNNIFEKIKNKIETGNVFQPILFLGENIELLNKEVNSIIEDLIKYYGVDKNYFYKLIDNKENLKIVQIKDFILKGNIKSSFKFQVFLIENISRMNNESFNVCLKFFEEPGKGNIIFLTNTSESGILETVLSRVQVVNLFSKKTITNSDFFLNLIYDYTANRNTNLIKYFFNDKKIERQDYISFLNTFLFYIKTNLVFIHLLDQIEDSLNLIQKNNVLPKYEIDKLLLKL